MNKTQKVILYTIMFFIIINIGYNGISTYLGFGLDSNLTTSMIAGTRDGLWFLFFLVCLLINPTKSRQIIKKTLFFVFFLLGISVLGFCLSKFYHQQSLFEIIIGFKSTVLPFFFLLSAIIIGEIFVSLGDDDKISNTENEQTTNNIRTNTLLIILIGGIIRQLAKVLFPDIFHSMGYGPIGDRHANQSPPMYYRTGPGGWMRLSGLFSGPNNYGYFLVLFFPYIINSFLQKQKTQGKDFFVAGLFIISALLTLSRGVIVGGGVVVLGFLPTIWSKYKQQIIKYKKILFGLGILSVLFFVFLSYKKLGSTIEHLDKWAEGRNYIMQSPIRGYGRGTSGPAFHLGGDIIPENFYFQLWIDLGIFGLLTWIGLRVFIYHKYSKKDQKKLFLGLFGLFAVGMFLHIWEDSMVNNLFFIVFGFCLGKEKDK